MPNVVDVPFIQGECPKWVVNMWTTWNTNRNTWLTEKSELRSYLFATDTRKTTNSKLPWKNSTVTPKLTQIRDNLHANYLAALFPSENWFRWEADDQDAVNVQKKRAITAYMKNKLKASSFELVVSQMLYDYIDYGNVFAGHEFVNETTKDTLSGETITTYRGPKAYRLSPLDIVMNPMASSFDTSPVIVRTMKTLGDIQKEAATKPELQYDPKVLEEMTNMRRFLSEHTDAMKDKGLQVDGFGSYQQYCASGLVELLEFWGDYYDVNEGKLYQDCCITVVDRMWVLRHRENPSWLGTKPFKHCGWRLRPDNLWAQGPLDQLVGMQYRIDHLENLKADVFDQIAHPVVIIKGNTVDAFEFKPGVQIHTGDEGAVEFVRPDAAALNADMQIANLMEKMEEMAGAPKQAMGIRTPGEKTKYEVQVLENGAGRIFQSKVVWFERNILEPLLNSMLEEAKRMLEGVDQIKTTDPDTGVEEFIQITKADIVGKGKLYPTGARHFAEKARFLQELTQTMQAVQSMPTVAPHISGWAVAQALEDTLGWQAYKIVKKNVALDEQMETQNLANAAQEKVQAAGAAPSELQSEDYVMPDMGGQGENNPIAPPA